VRPFKEITLNTGETKKVAWDEDKSRAKHDEIRRAVIEELRERDREVCRETGHDYLIREDGLIRLCHMADGKTERIFKSGVNPETGQDHLPKSRRIKDFWGEPASISHSGRETTAMIIERWRAFCSKPQEDSFVVATARHKEKYLRDGKPTVFGSPVVENPIPDQGVSTRQAFLSDQPKRKRGRPRKDEVSAVG
jgi:hypothetical protein